ncbi:ParA family protein [Alicyclobacillus macrosporangiidus]|uniref:Chromosome partitioning protein n=1 Tax=Alicyclobacillus macrosporangiidus TaxID=392015 RepID=A0A1I7KCQ3_9BACL|nr:ParA family protein [Alicyclobacillus macrosporangiidus]SFU95179.1 chromosome partitioning protein [Alicyclobacillus macrosporangiidus]
MATVFTFGIQKGGVGKTTTTGITAWLLSQKYRVLAVDFDSQGNLTQLLTGYDDLQIFREKTVLEAIKTRNPREYIYKVSDNLHILPADDFLSQFARWLYTEYRGRQKATVLKETLAVVSDDYDYILIDLPPNLGEQTINGITAADHNIVVLQAEPFCYNALGNYLEILVATQEQVNPAMNVLGILTSVIDPRTGVGQGILARTRDEYKDLVFDTIIHRRARVAEFAITGIEQRTKNDREALQMYESFIEELMTRVSEYESRTVAATNEPADN